MRAGKKCTESGGNTSYFKQIMVYLHTFLGNIEKAQEIAKSMSSIPTTCEMLCFEEFKGDAGFEEILARLKSHIK